MSNDILEEVQAINADYQAAVNSMKAEAKDALKTAFKRLFTEYPDVAVVAWQQYTPFFADGDPCEFSVHDVVVYSQKDMQEIQDGDDEFSYWEDGPDVISNETPAFKYNEEIGGYSWQDIEVTNPSLAEGANLAKKIISLLPNEALLALFGDHASVRIEKHGVSVEENVNHE